MIPPFSKFFILIVCLASVVLADDFKTIDGKEYKNVKVSRVEPDGLVLSSKSGISKVYFTELPKEVQERFHYDTAKGGAYSAEQTANQEALYKQRQEAERQRTEEREKYWNEHPAPQPAPVEQHSVASSMHGSALDQRPSGPQVMIYGEVTNVVDEGLLVSVRETNSFGTERIPSYAKVLLIGKFPGFYDEDKIQAVGRLVGAYEYTSVMGSKRTARALAGASVTKRTEFPSNVRN